MDPHQQQQQPEQQEQPQQYAEQPPQQQPYPQQPQQFTGQPPQQPGYPAGYPYPPAIPHPGRVLSIIGLVFAFVFLSIPGLILSILGYRQSKKTGRPEVLAILGIIFNSLAIVVSLGWILLIVFSFANTSHEAADTQRQSDAQSIRDAAASYKASSEKGVYPGISSTDFASDIATDKSIDLSPLILVEISTAHPSATDPNTYYLSYCGGKDAATATGFQVEYWSEAKKADQTTSTGSGCAADSDGSSDGIQNGASSGDTGTQLFN